MIRILSTIGFAFILSSCAQNKNVETSEFVELEAVTSKFNLSVYNITYGGFLESKTGDEVEKKLISVDRKGEISDVVNDVASDLDISVDGYAGGLIYPVKENHAFKAEIESSSFGIQDALSKMGVKSSSLTETVSVLLITNKIDKGDLGYSIAFGSESFLSKLNLYKPTKDFQFDQKGSLKFGKVGVQFNDLGNNRGQLILFNFEKPIIFKEKIILD